MDVQKTPAGPRFSEAARLAAKEAKRRKREEAAPVGAPELFIVRLSTEPSGFGWEVRRFGGVVIARGEAPFPSAAAARAAGSLALSRAGEPPQAPELRAGMAVRTGLSSRLSR